MKVMGNCFGQEEEEITTTVPYKEKYDAKFNALDINDEYAQAQGENHKVHLSVAEAAQRAGAGQQGKAS